MFTSMNGILRTLTSRYLQMILWKGLEGMENPISTLSRHVWVALGGVP